MTRSPISYIEAIPILIFLLHPLTLDQHLHEFYTDIMVNVYILNIVPWFSIMIIRWASHTGKTTIPPKPRELTLAGSLILRESTWAIKIPCFHEAVVTCTCPLAKLIIKRAILWSCSSLTISKEYLRFNVIICGAWSNDIWMSIFATPNTSALICTMPRSCIRISWYQ